MTIHAHAEKRTAMVKAISEHLGQEQHYDGPPSFNYRVGSVTITRDCSILGEQADLEALMPFLEERGYFVSVDYNDNVEPQVDNPVLIDNAPEPQPTEPEPVAIQEPVPEVPAEAAAEASLGIEATVITHTNTGMTVESLTNLIFMLYSKQYLLGKALGQQTIRISKQVIQELQVQRPENIEVFAEFVSRHRALEQIVGFDFKADEVSMTFPFCEEEPTRWMAYSQLLTRMIQRATEATRVHPDLLGPNPESEKYYMNSWLLRLGYSGVDSKEQRHILMAKLQGYAAFKTTAGMDKHKEKYSALRKAAREARKAATEDAE